MFKKGEDPSLALSKGQVDQMLDLMGLEITHVDKAKSQAVLVPKGFKDYAKEEPTGFLQYWMEDAYISQEVAELELGRKTRYKEYEVMDDNSAESSLTLDTYADEALASGRADESPVTIKISDKKLEGQVLDILKAQKVIAEEHNGFTAHRATIRTLAKYGDVFNQFIRAKQDSPVMIHRARDPSLIQKVWDDKTQTCLLFKKEDPKTKEKENLFP